MRTGNSSALFEAGQSSVPNETEQPQPSPAETEQPPPSPDETEQSPNETEQPPPSPDETEQPPSSPDETEQSPDETEQPPASAPTNEASPDETDQPQNILQLAAEDLIPLSPQVNIDDIIDDIIQELRRDDDIRDFLDEDEGIDLNVETEIEPIDYEVELW